MLREGTASLVVGVPPEWEHFQTRHKIFLEQLPHFVEYAEQVLDAAMGLLDEPHDRVVYGLVRTCLDEFMEIVVLCGNGYGIGGLKLVRTLYENAVTARYIQLHPEEAKNFLDFFFVSSKKILDAIDRETGQPSPPEVRGDLDREFNRVKAQFEVELCRECGHRGPNFRWSSKDFVTIATKATGLHDLLIPAYRDTLNYAHASAAGLFARMEGGPDVVTFRPAPHREEAAQALERAHEIVLRSLLLFGSHFKLEGYGEKTSRCVDDFRKAWNRGPADRGPN